MVAARRFRCGANDCPRKVFTEPMPGVAASYARRTSRLAEIQRHVGLVLGRAVGARLALSTATSAQNGGNMDYRRFAPGTTVWFPVSVPGALFYLGDGHACQGDGEIVQAGSQSVPIGIPQWSQFIWRIYSRILHRRWSPVGMPDYILLDFVSVVLRVRHATVALTYFISLHDLT